MGASHGDLFSQIVVGLVRVTAEGARVMRSLLQCSLVVVVDVTVAFMTGD